MFHPYLTSLALSDVDMDILVNISIFCPQLTSLAISKSEVSLHFKLILILHAQAPCIFTRLTNKII